MESPRDETKREVRPLPALLFGLAMAFACMALMGRPPAEADTLQTSITVSICGNGLVDGGEVCDDGLGFNTGGYGSTTAQRICTPDCQAFGPYCGDSILQVRFDEQCDNGPGNGTPGNLCSAQCVAIPAVPATSPPVVRGSTPFVPGAIPGAIPSATLTQVVLRGKAYPNADVNILLDGKTIGIAHADTNADFLFNTTSVAPGTETFSFWAKDSGGATSITTSVVFEVVQSAVTSVNNIFLPPTLSVSAQKIAPGGLLNIFGQSVPTAKVITTLDTDTSNALAADADKDGKWSLQLNTGSVTSGFHSAKASFTLPPTSKSGFGKSVSFFVGNQLPTGSASADLNGDGKINLVDFSIFLISWNTHDVFSDFNQDGTVNLADFSIMLFNWTG